MHFSRHQNLAAQESARNRRGVLAGRIRYLAAFLLCGAMGALAGLVAGVNF